MAENWPELRVWVFNTENPRTRPTTQDDGRKTGKIPMSCGFRGCGVEPAAFRYRCVEVIKPQKESFQAVAVEPQILR